MVRRNQRIGVTKAFAQACALHSPPSEVLSIAIFANRAPVRPQVHNIHVQETWLRALLVVPFLLSGLLAGDKPIPQEATLVEAVSKPRCYGLDCPPWPAPPNIAFCFRAGDTYYVGTDRSWGVPWANKAKKLQKLKGVSVKILRTDKEIKIVGPEVKMRLWVAHEYPVFSSDPCNHT